MGPKARAVPGVLPPQFLTTVGTGLLYIGKVYNQYSYLTSKITKHKGETKELSQSRIFNLIFMLWFLTLNFPEPSRYLFVNTLVQIPEPCSALDPCACAVDAGTTLAENRHQNHKHQQPHTEEWMLQFAALSPSCSRQSLLLGWNAVNLGNLFTCSEHGRQCPRP